MRRAIDARLAFGAGPRSPTPTPRCA